MSEEWISARDARELVSPGCTFVGPTTDAIRRHAAAGLVRARALVFVSTRAGQRNEVRNHLIPKDFWSEAPESQEWVHGYFSVRGRSQGWEVHTEALGVTFERRGVEAMVPASAAAGDSRQSASSDLAAPASVRKNPGGRPPYDWEAVMIELARQLYVGDLQPKTQADIEKAMLPTYLTKFPSRKARSGNTLAVFGGLSEARPVNRFSLLSAPFRPTASLPSRIIPPRPTAITRRPWRSIENGNTPT